MNKQKLTMKHKDLLFDTLFEIQSPLSEYSFSNLFLFRDAHQYELIDLDGNLFMAGITYDGVRHIMPMKDLKTADNKYINLLKNLLKDYDSIFPISEDWLVYFEDDIYEKTHTNDETDYIFYADKLHKFPGRKLHGKKNLLNQFLTKYKPGLTIFDNTNLDEVISILDEWQNQSGQEIEDTDYIPCTEAIRYFKELKLCGALFSADDKNVGFLIGEEINQEMFGIHFAKGLREYKGIFQYMFSRCSEIHKEKYKFINLEQDMGKENLRANKLSYIPDFMAIKYRISLKK